MEKRYLRKRFKSKGLKNVDRASYEDSMDEFFTKNQIITNYNYVLINGK